MSTSTPQTNPSFFEYTGHWAESTADGDKEKLDFTCVITGCGMLIVQSSVLWDVMLDMWQTHTCTHFVSTSQLFRLAVFVAQFAM